ncbi:MAG: hypothetical protein IJ722_07645 [Alloprevotella sp.]|nr:hypothetical protein [Alloprevotella sp.]
MGLFSIFTKKKKEEKGWRVGGIEDFMTLIRVYYQASMANQLGINNLAMLPDLRVFKQTLKVQTVNNRLGLGEKNRCKAMLGEIYGLPDSFFRETDASIKKGCRNIQQMQQYLYTFQGFTQELMMLVGNLMKWKFRVPGFMKKALRALTDKTIHDIVTKDTWKDEGVRKSVINVRRYQQQLGYSEEWMSHFVFNVLALAKKEPKPKDAEAAK